MGDVALLRALELADRLQQENAQLVHQNVQLAGQVGFMQSELQQAREQIRLLTDSLRTPQPDPPAEPAPAAQRPPKRLPWWRRLFADI